MRDLNNKLLSLMAIRVLVVLSVLLPYLLAPVAGEQGGGMSSLAMAAWDLMAGTGPLPDPEGPVQPEQVHIRATDRMLQLLVAVVSVQTLLYTALIRLLKNRSVLHAYVQLAGDMILITSLIYKFGGLSANLSILYFVVIGVASFLLRRQAGLIFAACACLLYGGVIFLHHSVELRELWDEGGPFAAPIVESFDGDPIRITWFERVAIALSPPGVESISSVPVAYTLSIHWIGFLASALFTSYLARDEQLESELKKSALDLAYLRVLHRDVIQSISSGLAVTDLRGITTSINRAGQDILGLKEDRLIGRHIAESGLFEMEEWDRLTELSSQEVVRAERHMELEGAEPVDLGFTLSHLQDGQGDHRGFIVIFQDLTEWRRLQDRVRDQDRMAALGQMAAGLAHEVGNPLAAISGSVQMLSKSAEGGSLQAKLLGITLKESQRLDRTVKAFLQFARPKARDPQKIDVAKVLSDDVTLLLNSAEVLPGHRIELDLEPESALIVADRDQLSQLFWNLARNALQAMPEGGLLKLTGRRVGEIYRMEIRDNGKGMSEEERAELFQPFKTFFGKGTGLGMAIVYRIIEEHHGNIEVDSRPGLGTVITVEIPVEPPLSDGEQSSVAAIPEIEGLDYPHPQSREA